MSVIKEYCEGHWLDGDQAHVVIAQLVPVDREIMCSDAARPSVLVMLTQLLAGERRLSEIVTQGRPAILILPELALAFSDWATVDTLVRAYPSPLILISGFSVTRGDALVNWLAAAPSETERRATWAAVAPPAAERIYNGGWCWIHRPAIKTTCVTFQKTTAEQRDEIRIEGLDTGHNTFCLELDDLIIFPVICSDFLATAGGQRLVAAKIIGHIAQYNNDARKILIMGLLSQNKGHVIWRTAISDIARLINIDKVNICLVNWAYDILFTQEDEDRWRDYSGVYLASERQPTLIQMRSVRRFSTDTLEGAVSRITEACVLGGPVRWTFSATARNVWAVSKDYLMGPDGMLLGSCCDDPIKYELVRFIRRMTETADAPADSSRPCIREGLSKIKLHLAQGNAPNAEFIVHTTLFGKRDRNSEKAISADGLPRFSQELAQGIKALGALSLVAGIMWQTDAQTYGQLRQDDNGLNILVWSSPELAITVKQQIDRWRSDALRTSPLIIFSKASGAIIPSQSPSNRRADIGSSPAPAQRSAAEPSQRNSIIEANLDELAECVHEDTTLASVQALTAVLSAKTELLKTQETG